MFLSEFSIFRAGLEQRHYLTTALLVVFITVAFFGILLHVNRMVFGRPAETPTPAHAGLPFTCMLTLVLAAIPVLLLGVYQPLWLHDLLTLAASNLSPLPASP